MNRRWIVVSALILIGGILLARYTIQWKRQKDSDAIKKTLLAQRNAGTPDEIVTPDKIVEMHIINHFGEFHLERNEFGKWIITKPTSAKADPQILDSFPKVLVGMRIDPVNRKPKNLEPYGLDEPDIKVKYRIRLKNKDFWQQIYFGRRSPVQGSYYALDPDKGDVMLIPFELKFLFNLRLVDLRDKSIVTLPHLKITRLVLRFPDKTYEFIRDRKTNEWWVEKPVAGLADSGKIGAVLSKMNRQEKIAFPEISGDDKETGFDSPALILSLYDPNAVEKTITIGAKAKRKGKETLRYAKIENEDGIFLLDGAFWLDEVSKAMKTPLWERAYFRFRGRMRSIHCEKDGVGFTMSRSGKKPKWKVVGMENRTPEFLKFRNELKIIFNMPQQGYVGATATEAADRFGLDKPKAFIHIHYVEKVRVKEQKLFFGKTDPSGKYVYTYSNLNPYIRLVDKKALDLIPTNPEKFFLDETQGQ